MRADRLLILSVSLFIVTACGGNQPPIVDASNAVPVTRLDGAATCIACGVNEGKPLPDTILLTPGNEIFTADQSVTLQLSDGSTLRLHPNSFLILQEIRSTDRRPVFRLMRGELDANAHSDGFSVQAYGEAAIKLTMVPYDLTVLPHNTASIFRLWFDANTLNAYVETGEAGVQAGNQQATLPTGWQAIVEPDAPLKLVQRLTPIPSTSDTATPTSTATPTQAPTDTLTPTPTPTATTRPTRIPQTVKPTVTPTPSSVPPQPTQPAATEKPASQPKPTNPPPQPTEPPPPQPTNPPPPPTEPPPPPPTEPPPPPTEPPPPPTDRPPPPPPETPVS